MTHTRTAKEFPDPSHPASTDAAEAFTTGGRMEGRPTARDGIYVSSAESQLSDLFPSEATQGDGFDGVADDRGMDLFLSEADTHKGSDTWATRVFVDAHALPVALPAPVQPLPPPVAPVAVPRMARQEPPRATVPTRAWYRRASIGMVVGAIAVSALAAVALLPFAAPITEQAPVFEQPPVAEPRLPRPDQPAETSPPANLAPATVANPPEATTPARADARVPGASNSEATARRPDPDPPPVIIKRPAQVARPLVRQDAPASAKSPGVPRPPVTPTRPPPSVSRPLPADASASRPVAERSVPAPPVRSPQGTAPPSVRSPQNTAALAELPAAVIVGPPPVPGAAPPAPPASALPRPEGRPTAAGPTAPVTERTEVSDTGVIRTVLNRYRSAFSSLDVNGAVSVWPGVDARALKRAFDRLEEQEVVFDGCTIQVAGARAVASCAGSARYVPKVGSRTRTTDQRQWTFNLHKAGDGWLIDGVTAR